MENTCTINTVTENEDAQSVTVSCTVSINSTNYPQTYQVASTDNATIIASVTNQAESFMTSQLNAIAINETAANASQLSSLDGMVIDL